MQLLDNQMKNKGKSFTRIHPVLKVPLGKLDKHYTKQLTSPAVISASLCNRGSGTTVA